MKVTKFKYLAFKLTFKFLFSKLSVLCSTVTGTFHRYYYVQFQKEEREREIESRERKYIESRKRLLLIK